MHVVIVSNEWPPTGGGVGTSLRSMLEGTASLRDEYDVDITVFAPGEDADCNSRQYPYPRVTVIRLGVGKRQDHRGRLQASWRWVRRMRRVKIHADLWHIWDALPGVFVARKPFILTVHGADVPGRDPKRDALFKLIGPLYRRQWLRAESVTAVTPHLTMLASDFCLNRSVLHIPNGVVLLELPERHRPEGSLNILVVTRFDRLKNVHLAIQVAQLVAQQHRVRIVGDGPEKQQYEWLNRHNLELPGWCQNLDPHYRWADIFLNVTSPTGVSMTMMEAKTYGLPIVATRFPNCEQVRGLYPTEADAQQVVKTLEWVQEHYLEASAASASDRNDYAWTTRARPYFDLYRRLYDEGRLESGHDSCDQTVQS